jgi:hypothetical protein
VTGPPPFAVQVTTIWPTPVTVAIGWDGVAGAPEVLGVMPSDHGLKAELPLFGMPTACTRNVEGVDVLRPEIVQEVSMAAAVVQPCPLGVDCTR